MTGAMRRPVALLLVAVLVTTALALPVAGWAWATVDAVVGLDPPALAEARPGEPPEARHRASAPIAHLLFRGPPSPVGSSEASFVNLRGEETWQGEAGSRRSSSS